MDTLFFSLAVTLNALFIFIGVDETPDFLSALCVSLFFSLLLLLITLLEMLVLGGIFSLLHKDKY
jgi:hypothetical protein